jgi:hypothetical protein
MADIRPDLATLDPKGLIRESYRIDGIGEPECRSIFLDWAIGVPMGVEARTFVDALLTHYGPDHPDHPMTKVLRDGLGAAPGGGRRGGRRARVGG